MTGEKPTPSLPLTNPPSIPASLSYLKNVNQNLVLSRTGEPAGPLEMCHQGGGERVYMSVKMSLPHCMEVTPHYNLFKGFLLAGRSVDMLFPIPVQNTRNRGP